MFRDFDTFTLRPLARGDAQSLARHLNNPKILCNLRHPTDPYTIQDAEEFLEQQISMKEQGRVAAIAVDGALGGWIGDHLGEKIASRRAAIGYWLGESFWGQGIMTRAVSHLTEYLFTNTEVVRVDADVFAWNPASARVLEKCGFVPEARLKQAVWKNNEVTDLLVYARWKDLA